MDTKEEETATCYPNLNFIIDSFQEVRPPIKLKIIFAQLRIVY